MVAQETAPRPGLKRQESQAAFSLLRPGLGSTEILSDLRKRASWGLMCNSGSPGEARGK